MEVETVVWLVVAVATTAVLVLFWKKILRFLMILGIVAVAIWIIYLVVTSGVLDHVDGKTLSGAADVMRVLRRAPEPETQPATNVGLYICIGAGGTMAVIGALVAGVFYLRYRVEKSRGFWGKQQALPSNRSNAGKFPVIVLDGEIDLGWGDW